MEETTNPVPVVPEETNLVEAPAEATAPTPVEPDLETLRDEKCIPLARKIITDLGTYMIPEDASQKIDLNPLILRIMQSNLDADTNIATENPYIFQLVLGALAGLNAAVQRCDVPTIDDVRFGKIQKKVLDIVSEANITLGSVTPEESEADFKVVVEQLNVLFKEENLSYIEIKYFMDQIFSLWSQTTDFYNGLVAQQSEKAEAKLFGIEVMSDLTMKKLDEALR